MRGTDGRFQDASELALAIRLYLERNKRCITSSTEIFEMAVKVLRRCRLDDAAGQMEAHRLSRADRRARLAVCHDDGRATCWDKAWLCEWARRSWLVSATTARILAGSVEDDMLAGGGGVVSRADVLDRLNARVAEYGLADAVPVRRPAIR